MSFSSSQGYDAHDALGALIRVSLQVKRIAPYRFGSPAHTFEPVIWSESAVGVAPIQHHEMVLRMPSFRAWLNGEESEIHIEDIRRECLIPGQRFAARTIRQFLEITPTARSIYLANIMNSFTAKIVRDALSSSPHCTLDSVQQPGPLISALLECGCSQITPVQESSAYIGIRAFIKNYNST